MTSNQKGFTLVELIVYVMIIIVVFAGLASVLSSSINAWLLSNQLIDAQQSARMGLRAIVKELELADAIFSPTDGNVNSILTFTLDEDHLPYTSSIPITYKLGKADGTNPHTLYRIKNSGANPLTEEVVHSLSFVRTGRLVDISLQITDKASNSVLFTAKTSVVCRNIPQP